MFKRVLMLTITLSVLTALIAVPTSAQDKAGTHKTAPVHKTTKRKVVRHKVVRHKKIKPIVHAGVNHPKSMEGKTDQLSKNTNHEANRESKDFNHTMNTMSKNVNHALTPRKKKN